MDRRAEAGDAPTPRATLPVKDVAAQLGKSATRVRQMLDSTRYQLAGPTSKGKGVERLVWIDTIGLDDLGGQPRSDSDEHQRLIDELARTKAQLADVTTALQFVNISAEKLRDAAREQDRAYRLLRRANKAQRRATTLALEAEEARQQAMTPFALEDPPRT